MKTTLSLFTVFLLSNILTAQTTLIPDVNFEKALIALGHDTGTPNGSVPTANIDTLTSLFIIGQGISSLIGIEDFQAITDLRCQVNQISSVDLTKNTALEFLIIASNNLTSLDLSKNLALGALVCSSNKISTIDVSEHSRLVTLICHHNELTSLNIKNGNNANYIAFEANDNPELSCIEVDDVAFSTLRWTDIDSTTSFSNNCSGPSASVLQGNNPTKEVSIYPNPTNGTIYIDLEENSTLLKTTLRNTISQVISTQEFENTNNISLTIEAPQGIYFLTLETPMGESRTIKVFKE